MPQTSKDSTRTEKSKAGRMGRASCDVPPQQCLPACAKCFKPPGGFALRIAHLQGAAQNGCDSLLDLSLDAKGHSSLPLLTALPRVSEV